MQEVNVTDMTDLKRLVIETARRMNALGINVNKSGNVSARASLDGLDGFFITPTGIDYDALEVEDIVFIALDQSVRSQIPNKRLPSSEWLMHERVYCQRADVKAIVHTHSVYATALACQELGIPAFHYMVAAAGGDRIDCAPYALFGSEKLADKASDALRQRNACLLSHHGVLACGKDLSGALKLAHEVENLAHMYTLTRMLGEPKILTSEQMGEVLERFQTYGQQR